MHKVNNQNTPEDMTRHNESSISNKLNKSNPLSNLSMQGGHEEVAEA